jgi:Sulfotransferase domain
MKVIGAGFGRTGATSLKAALEELGFDPRYHVRGPFDNPEHVRLWETVARGKPVD